MRMSDEPGKAAPKGADRAATPTQTQRHLANQNRPQSNNAGGGMGALGGALAEAMKKAQPQQRR
jgi:hypothetical protein